MEVEEVVMSLPGDGIGIPPDFYVKDHRAKGKLLDHSCICHFLAIPAPLLLDSSSVGNEAESGILPAMSGQMANLFISRVNSTWP